MEQGQLPPIPQPETIAQRRVRVIQNLWSLIDNQQIQGIAQANAILEMGTFVNSLLEQAKAELPAEPPKKTEENPNAPAAG